MFAIQYKPTKTAVAVTQTSEQWRIPKDDVAHEGKGGQKPLRISKWLIEDGKGEVLLCTIQGTVLSIQQRREPDPSDTLKT